MLVAFGAYLSGLNGANAFARYAIAVPGAAGTAFVLAFHAHSASPAEKRWIVAAVLGFSLYGIAAGLIVPPVQGWEGDFFNYNDFIRVTGMPVQFVRGLLACGMAFSIWGFWGQRQARDVASARYTRFMHRQFVWTLVAMATILVFGWVLTEYLGGIYKQNVQNEAQGDLDLIFSRLTGETSAADGMVKVIAGSRSVSSLLIDGDRRNEPRVISELRLDSEVSGARDAFILDRAGTVVASYSRDNTVRVGEAGYATTPYFQSALAGESGYYFEVTAQGKARDYYASYPVRDEVGDIAGVAVLRKSLDSFKSELKRFDVSFFLIDPNGVIVITNLPGAQFRTLWPLSPAKVQALLPRFGTLDSTPLLSQEMTGMNWVVVNGVRDYVQRRPIPHSDWSVVTTMAPKGIFASRVLGIIITLQMTTLALVYLVGRERWVHDNVQQQKRTDLEELARDLDIRAATDPLTGLYNRRKFSRELATEMLRAQRYNTPLSLTLFDVDHFKVINDTFGHQVGDEVLVELSRIVAMRIRSSDVLARWGGEEFMILTPGVTDEKAGQLAENLGAAIRGSAIDQVDKITCSFGVARLEAGDTAETLIARADEALYCAKINGRDRVELAPPRASAAPSLVPMG